VLGIGSAQRAHSQENRNRTHEHDAIGRHSFLLASRVSGAWSLHRGSPFSNFRQRPHERVELAKIKKLPANQFGN
jgi:hypothetical protein